MKLKTNPNPFWSAQQVTVYNHPQSKSKKKKKTNLNASLIYIVNLISMHINYLWLAYGHTVLITTKSDLAASQEDNSTTTDTLPHLPSSKHTTELKPSYRNHFIAELKISVTHIYKIFLYRFVLLNSKLNVQLFPNSYESFGSYYENNRKAYERKEWECETFKYGYVRC